ncbi:Pre-mRNA splicing factor [Balamuthia mandrillaris]
MLGAMEAVAKRKTVFKSAVVVIPPPQLWDGPLQDIRRQHDRGFVRWMPHITLLFPFVEDLYFEEAHQRLTAALSSMKPFTLRFRKFDFFEHSKSYTVWAHPEDEVWFLLSHGYTFALRPSCLLFLVAPFFLHLLSLLFFCCSLSSLFSLSLSLSLSSRFLLALCSSSFLASLLFLFFPFFSSHFVLVWVYKQPEGSLKELQRKIEEAYPYCDAQSTKSDKGFTAHMSVGQFKKKAEMLRKIKEFEKIWDDSFEFVLKEVYLISRTADDPFEVRYVVPLGEEGAQSPPHFESSEIPDKEKKLQDLEKSKRTLYVGNLPSETTEEELRELFASTFSVRSVDIPKRGNDGRSKYFGFVEFDSEEEKERAMKEMNQTTLKDRTITLQNAN